MLKRNFHQSKLLRLILEKLELINEDPFKYAREKLGIDKCGNPMFSVEVTGDIRILYSVDSNNCVFFILDPIRRFTDFSLSSSSISLIASSNTSLTSLKSLNSTKVSSPFLHSLHTYYKPLTEAIKTIC